MLMKSDKKSQSSFTAMIRFLALIHYNYKTEVLLVEFYS